MDLEIRKATTHDIKEIKKILSYYFLESDTVEKNIHETILASLDEKTVGCAVMDTGDITELKCIAVYPGYRNRGIGSRLVDSVLDSTGAKSVYIRTTSPAFFEKKGFKRLDNSEKKIILKDCGECEKFDMCQQVIMKIDIEKS